MKSLKSLLTNQIDLNEGWAQKAASNSNAGDDATKNLSDAAKKAIEAAQKNVGDNWDSVSKQYTSVISKIDAGAQKYKQTYADWQKLLGVGVDLIEGKIADFTMSVLQANKNCSKVVDSWIKDESDKGVDSMMKFSVFCVGALAGTQAGFKPQDFTDALAAIVEESK